LKNVRDDRDLRARYERARAVFFDCDGVIFDSNGFKIAGMHRALSGYGAGERAAMEEFWRANGGVSRYEKFRHFFTRIAPEPDVPEAVRGAAERFGAFSRAEYTLHEPVPEALALARHAGAARCQVVSGAILIGDGAGDFRVASTLDMPFVYLAQFSEWRGAGETLTDAPGVSWADDWSDLLARLIG
jgi:hypothetical protein